MKFLKENGLFDRLMKGPQKRNEKARIESERAKNEAEQVKRDLAEVKALLHEYYLRRARRMGHGIFDHYRWRINRGELSFNEAVNKAKTIRNEINTNPERFVDLRDN